MVKVQRVRVSAAARDFVADSGTILGPTSQRRQSPFQRSYLTIKIYAIKSVPAGFPACVFGRPIPAQPEYSSGAARWLQRAGVHRQPVDRLEIGQQHIQVPIRERWRRARAPPRDRLHRVAVIIIQQPSLALGALQKNLLRAGKHVQELTVVSPNPAPICLAEIHRSPGRALSCIFGSVLGIIVHPPINSATAPARRCNSAGSAIAATGLVPRAGGSISD